MVWRRQRRRPTRTEEEGQEVRPDPEENQRRVPLRALAYEEGREALRPEQGGETKLTRSKAGEENTTGELLEVIDQTPSQRAEQLRALLRTKKNDKGGDGFMAVATALSGPGIRDVRVFYRDGLDAALDRFFGTSRGKGFATNKLRRAYVQSLLDNDGKPSGIARLCLQAGLLHASHAIDQDALTALGHTLTKADLEAFVNDNRAYLKKHDLLGYMESLAEIGHRTEEDPPGDDKHDAFLVELVKRHSGRKKARLGRRRFDREPLIADLERWANRDDVGSETVRGIVLRSTSGFRKILQQRAGKNDAKLVVNTLASSQGNERVEALEKTEALLERGSQRNKLRRRTHRQQTARQIELTLFPKGGPDIEALLRRYDVFKVGEAVDLLRKELEESKSLSKEQIDRICLRLTLPGMSEGDVKVYQDLKKLSTSRKRPHHLRYGRRALALVIQLKPKTEAFELARNDKALVAALARRSATRHWTQIKAWLGVDGPGEGGDGNEYLEQARQKEAGEVVQELVHPPQRQEQDDTEDDEKRREAVKTFAGKIKAEVTKRVPDRSKVYRLYFLAQEESKSFNNGELDPQFIRDIDDIVEPWKLGHMRFSLGRTRWEDSPLTVDDVLSEAWGKIAGINAKGKTDVDAIETFVKEVPGGVLRDQFFDFEAVRPALDPEDPAATRRERLKHVVDLKAERRTQLNKHLKRGKRTRVMAKMRRRMAKAIDGKPTLVGAWYMPDEAPLAARQIEAVGRLEVERLLQSGKQFRTWSTSSMARSEKANEYVGELRSTRRDISSDPEQRRESLDQHVENLKSKRGELKEAQKHFEEKRALYKGRVQKAIALIAGLLLTFLGTAMGIPAAVPLIQFMWGLGSGLLTTTMRLIADRIIEGDDHEKSQAIAEYVTAFVAGAFGHVAGGVCWFIDSSFAGSVHYAKSDATKILGKPFLGILKSKTKEVMGMPSRLLMHYAQSTHPFRNSANDAEAYVKSKTKALPEELLKSYTNGIVSLGIALGAIAKSDKLVGLLPSGIRSVDPNKDPETWKKEHNVFHDSDGAFWRSFFGTDPKAKDQGMGGLSHTPRGSGWFFDGQETDGQGQIGTKAGLRLLGWDAYERTSNAMTGQVRKGLGRGLLGTQVSDEGVKGRKTVGQKTDPQQTKETAYRKRAVMRRYGIEALVSGSSYLQAQAKQGGEKRKNMVRDKLGSDDERTGLYGRFRQAEERARQDGMYDMVSGELTTVENTLQAVVTLLED